MNEPEILDPYCNPDAPKTITFDEITSAAYRIKSGVVHTECTKSEHLTNLTGMEIYIKKEYLQATGSFKERGARYSMMMMSPDMRRKGIVAASAGNHAQACCYHGLSLGIPVTVVMPETAPLMKIEKCRNYKGNVLVQGKNLTESKKIALAYARDHGMMYLNGYDHPQVLAGQGTIGLEIWEQVPGLQAVIVPVGGGGLIAGITVAIKALNKNITVIGVEPERAACLTGAFKAGKPVDILLESTLADGLAVGKIGVNSFEIVRRILDKCVTVKEQYVALGILRLVEYEKCVVEGAGASPLAAILQGLVPELRGKKVVLILSGGNIDTTVLGRALERGLAADGRLVKVKVGISDRVGGIEDLTATIGSLGVHIKDMQHERAWVVQDVFKVEVKVICECRDREHSLSLRDVLAKKYGFIFFNGHLYPDDNMSGTTGIYAGQPSAQPQIPGIASGAIQQNMQDLQGGTGRAGISAAASHASAPPQGVTSFPQPLGGGYPQYMQPTVPSSASQEPHKRMEGEPCEPCNSEHMGGSMHPSCEPCIVDQTASARDKPPQQGAGSFTPSQGAAAQYPPGAVPQQASGIGEKPSQQVGASLTPSQAANANYSPGAPQPASAIGEKPSQQVGASLTPSQAANAQYSPGAPQPASAIGEKPSQQVGASLTPSQAANAQYSPGAPQPAFAVGGTFVPQQSGNVLPNQQYPTKEEPVIPQAGSQVGSAHPSQQAAAQVGQSPSNAPPLADERTSQAGTQMGSSHPSEQARPQSGPPDVTPLGDQKISQSGPPQLVKNDVGLMKAFSNCACKRRGAPGDYKK